MFVKLSCHGRLLAVYFGLLDCLYKSMSMCYFWMVNYYTDD